MTRWRALKTAWRFRRLHGGLLAWYRFWKGISDQPSETELESQRRSFVYGNCAIDNPNVTREMVDDMAEKMGGRR